MQFRYKCEDKSFLFCFCNKCCQFFDSEEILDKHNIWTHTDYKVLEDNEEKLLKCEAFTHKTDFPIDQLMHLDKIKYECEICGDTFGLESILTTHRNTHKLPPILSEKNKLVNRMTHNNKKEKRIHTGKSPYKCRSCSREFSRQSTFSRHRRLHIIEKGYGCKKCNTHYSSHYYLMLHKMRIHDMLHR